VLEITFPDRAGAAGGPALGATHHPLKRPRPLRYAVEAAQLPPHRGRGERRLRVVGRAGAQGVQSPFCVCPVKTPLQGMARRPQHQSGATRTTTGAADVSVRQSSLIRMVPTSRPLAVSRPHTGRSCRLGCPRCRDGRRRPRGPTRRRRR